MQDITFNNYIYFYLLENLIAFINHKQYLIINAKYYSSRMNNVHMMSPADMSASTQSHMANIILFEF